MHQQMMLAHGAGVTPPATWNAYVASLNPWGWWKLDETAGPGVVCTDYSGNGRHGAYTAAGTQTTGLFAGSSAAQATLGGRITLPSFTTQATPAFTAVASLRTTHMVNAEQQILSADNGSTGRIFQFRKTGSSMPSGAQAVLVNPSTVTMTGSAPINDGNPHLCGLTFDQSLPAASGRMKIYEGGVVDTQTSTAVTIASGLTCALGVGARYGGANTGLWLGASDEILFFDRALSQTEFSNLYAARNNP